MSFTAEISVPLNFEGVPLFKQDDPKLGSILKQGLSGDIVTIGFPFDEGVIRNGGRAGTSQGPDRFRFFLSRIGPIVNPEFNLNLSSLQISDFGNISASDFDSSHASLKSTSQSVLDQGKIAMVIGGGKDQSWSNGLAFLEHCKNSNTKPIIVNIDAHLDVRGLNDQGLVHSGCAFRLLLEHPDYKERGGSFLEFASQGSQCAMSHVNFVREAGGELVWMRDIRRTGVEQGEREGIITQGGTAFRRYLEGLAADCKVFVSFEIDAIAARDCPGVSCPSVDGGLTSEEALEIMMIAGRDSRVCIVDLSEYSPQVEEYLTGRLLANLVYYFYMGYAQRSH